MFPYFLCASNEDVKYFLYKFLFIQEKFHASKSFWKIYPLKQSQLRKLFSFK